MELNRQELLNKWAHPIRGMQEAPIGVRDTITHLYTWLQNERRGVIADDVLNQLPVNNLTPSEQQQVLVKVVGDVASAVPADNVEQVLSAASQKFSDFSFVAKGGVSNSDRTADVSIAVSVESYQASDALSASGQNPATRETTASK